MGCICGTKRGRASSEDIRQLDKVSSIDSYASTPSSPNTPRQSEADIVYETSPNSFGFEATDGRKLSQSSDGDSHRFHDQHKVNLYSKQNSKPFASGAFAAVFLCEFLGVEYALKKVCVVMDGDDHDHDDAAYHRWSGKTTLKEAENELEILRTLQSDGGHLNVVQLIDDFYETTPYDDVYLYLVMEFVPSSLDREMAKYQNDGEAVPSPLIKVYSFQILKALRFMKRRGVIHRDLKPENILLNPRSNELKICDFGCSAILDSAEQSMASYVCSRYYRAPELLFGARRYGHAVDVWSFGCILSEMYLGHVLFDGDSAKNQITEIMQVLGAPQEAEWAAMNAPMGYEAMTERFASSIECAVDAEEARNWRYALMPCEVEEDAIDLIDAVLLYDPAARRTAVDALEHEWFEGLSDDHRLLNEYKVPREALTAEP